MMTEAQFLDGISYAEDNFKNENAPHLHVDKKLIREKFNLDGKKVLDFGCGMGGMTLWYAKNWNCEIDAFDIDGHHIEIAQYMKDKHHVGNVHFAKRNILDNPTPDDTYDFIFMNDVVEHIPFPVLSMILKALHKSLRQDGKIFVTFPPWRSPYASHLTHVIPIPWCQFLPDFVLMPMIEKRNLTLVGEEVSDLKSDYKALNHLTFSKFSQLSKEAGFKVEFRKSRSFINKISALKDNNFNIFPLDFFVTKEFVLLSKP